MMMSYEDFLFTVTLSDETYAGLLIKVEEFYRGARRKNDIIDLIKKSFDDPTFEMFTATGVFNFEKLPGGKFKILGDEYNFDKSKSLKDRSKPMDAYSRAVYDAQDISEGGGYTFYVKGVI